MYSQNVRLFSAPRFCEHSEHLKAKERRRLLPSSTLYFCAVLLHSIQRVWHVPNVRLSFKGCSFQNVTYVHVVCTRSILKYKTIHFYGGHDTNSLVYDLVTRKFIDFKPQHLADLVLWKYNPCFLEKLTYLKSSKLFNFSSVY